MTGSSPLIPAAAPRRTTMARLSTPVLAVLAVLVTSLAAGCTYSFFYTVIAVQELDGTVEVVSDGQTHACAPQLHGGISRAADGGLQIKLDCGEAFLSLDLDSPVSEGTAAVPMTLALRKKSLERITPDVPTTGQIELTTFGIETRWNDDEDTAEYGEVEALTLDGSVFVEQSDGPSNRFLVDVSIIYEEAFEVGESHYD